VQSSFEEIHWRFELPLEMFYGNDGSWNEKALALDKSGAKTRWIHNSMSLSV
jgi:hypothetical protein